MNLCIHWCAYAKECVGPELYEQLTKGDKERKKVTLAFEAAERQPTAIFQG